MIMKSKADIEAIMRPFNLIVSCSENRVIGRNGRLPWSIPEDRRFFETMTAGQTVVLGRICFQTWPGASRDGRRAVVITRDAGLAGPSVQTAPSLAEALTLAQSLPGEIYICGGERIYLEAMSRPEAARLYLTLIHAEVSGDRFFPDWRLRFPREIERREGADAAWRYTFLTLAA
jgi:dihydrofolate reductase